MVGLRKEYHEIKARLADCKARSGEEAKRSDALNALKKLADIATEGGLDCDEMMGKVAALFGGELMASYRDANLVEQHFGSNVLYDMEHLMQAVRHGVPVDNYRGR